MSKAKTETKANKSQEVNDKAKQALEDTLIGFLTAKNDIKNSQDFKRFLAITANNYNYSLGNLCLILSQKPEASIVKSYKDWQKVFEQTNSDKAYIKKGSGIMIRVPMYKKIDPDIKKGDPEYERNKRSFFGTGYVFDISDIENFDHDTQFLKRYNVNQDTQAMTDLYSKLKSEALKLDIIRSITEAELDPDLGGYARNTGLKTDLEEPISDIVINQAKTDSDKLRTLAHELTHAMLHIGKASKTKAELQTTESSHIRSIFESEAESVAYIVSQHIGLTSDDSLIYVASWEGDKSICESSIKRILVTAKTIINMLEFESENTEA